MDMVIVHYTGMPDADLALNWLCGEEGQVSCHYFVFEDGRINQLVAEKDRAWHAGKSSWKGNIDINSHSVGIEIANRGHQHGYVDFPAVQMNSVVKLVQDIVQRNKIPNANILAHSDIAPTRKDDPGERFDWQLLYQAGLGNWIAPSSIIAGDNLEIGAKGEDVRRFQKMLHKLGFGIVINGEFDALTLACTKAFQRHYRQQKVDGIADPSTRDTLRRLLDKIDETGPVKVET